MIKKELTIEEKNLIKLADNIYYKKLKHQENITDWIYYQFFVLKKKLQKIEQVTTYKVKRNFEIKLINLRYFIYKKCIAHSGKNFVYKRINFDFLNSKVGSFIYTKKLGGNIHSHHEKKKK